MKVEVEVEGYEGAGGGGESTLSPASFSFCSSRGAIGDAMDMRLSVVGLARISLHLAMWRSAGTGANLRLQCGHSTRSSGTSSMGAGGSPGVRADLIALRSASLCRFKRWQRSSRLAPSRVNTRSFGFVLLDSAPSASRCAFALNCLLAPAFFRPWQTAWWRPRRASRNCRPQCEHSSMLQSVSAASSSCMAAASAVNAVTNRSALNSSIFEKLGATEPRLTSVVPIGCTPE